MKFLVWQGLTIPESTYGVCWVDTLRKVRLLVALDDG